MKSINVIKCLPIISVMNFGFQGENIVPSKLFSEEPPIQAMMPDPQCSITWDTYENTHNEWAVDMTAHFDDIESEYIDNITVRWFVKAQFTGYQWIEYTWGPTGPHKEYLTIEQLYGYCFQVYIEVEYNYGSINMWTSNSDTYNVCYIEPL